MELQYENIRLRTAEKRDAGQLAAWWNDGAVMAHAGFPHGLGITEDAIVAKLRPGLLVIEENGRLIGECNYRKLDNARAEIGIKICETDCLNRGVGRVALCMLICWLFDSGFRKVILDTNLENKRAQRVYESLGFQRIRVNYDSWTDQLGNRQSSVDYELTEADFVDCRAKE